MTSNLHSNGPPQEGVDNEYYNSATTPVEFNLTNFEREEMMTLIEPLPLYNPRLVYPDSFYSELRIQAQGLPERLRRSLEMFRTSPPRAGAIVVTNLPTDPVPGPTPPDGRATKQKNTSIAEYSLMMIMSLLGDLYTFAQEKHSELPATISPIMGYEMRQENNSSTVTLGFHTEVAGSEFSPSYVGLAGIRQDREKQAKTIVASVQEAVDTLAPPVIEMLRREAYRIYPPSSFGDTTSYVDVPILSGPSHNLKLVLRPDVEPHNPEAAFALNELIKALERVVQNLEVTPGTICIIDNARAAHGRSFFTPHYDGRDRWLIRVYATRQWHHIKDYVTPNTRFLVPSMLVYRLKSWK